MSIGLQQRSLRYSPTGLVCGHDCDVWRANRHPRPVESTAVPQIISMSYGECEAQLGAAGNFAYEAVYLQAVLEGVSVFVSAGDNGAALCDNTTFGPAQSGISVNGFASTAYNVAVGGTDFGDYYEGTTSSYWSTNNSSNYGSALSYVPEIPWNDTCGSVLISSFVGYQTPYGSDGFCASSFGAYFLDNYAGSGGPSACASGTSATGIDDGTCQGYKKPIWQNVLGNPNDGVRDLPDVSIFAGDGVWDHAYAFCFSDVANGGVPCTSGPASWSQAGGTSFGTPIMAGIQALVNQKWGKSQGNPAPVFYTLARIEYGQKGNASCQSFAQGGPPSNCLFHDITVGDIDVDCTVCYCYTDHGNTNAVGVLSLSDKSRQAGLHGGPGWDFATGLGSVNAANLVFHPIWQYGWQQYWNQGWGPR